MMVLVVPTVGLSIDTGLLYAVQTKLSAAVDAGALAGCRSLSRGLDAGSQASSAQTTARNYVLANFPPGFFSTSNLVVTSTVDQSQTNVRSVTTTATVQAPMYFLRYLNASATTVSATATAQRRDVNVEIVIDRSGSLANSNSCAPMKAAATGFVSRFAEGRDNVGLITFATSSWIDFPIGNTFQSASPNVSSIINSVTCSGATSSAQALWQGYTQLAQLNQPNALNVILFFTDGQPTGVTAAFPILSSSTCTSKTAKTGVLVVGFTNNGATPSDTGGLVKNAVGAQPLTNDVVTISSSAGCYFNSNIWDVSQDVSYIPNTDTSGNSLDNGYQYVQRSGGNIVDNNPDTLINASTNAADNAGWRIRRGTAPGGVPGLNNVVIFAIGLGNSGFPANDDLLRRISNDPSSTTFDSSQPTGLYVYAPTAADLSDAFSRIASEILRLSK